MVDSDATQSTPIRGRRRFLVITLASTVAVATAVVLCLHCPPAVSSKIPRAAQVTRGAMSEAAHGATPTTTPSEPVPPAAAPSTPTTLPAVIEPAATASAVAQPVIVEPTIATLVVEVEAAGVEPGSNWTWSVGDTAAHCGPISGSGTGCTFGAAGLEYTVFAGSPNLPLVAHELANAETQNDAVPGLLSAVAAAERGSSWSPTDAVASCLVAHFMGIQDDAAGSWTCSPAVATFVANNIHDTLTTKVGAIAG
jgi:hypothetical protein